MFGIENKSNQQVLLVSVQDLQEGFRSIMQETFALFKEEAEAKEEKAEEEKLLTTKEVMKYCGVVRSTIWHWVKNEYLKPIKMGKKKNMYKLSDVKRVWEAQTDLRG